MAIIKSGWKFLDILKPNLMQKSDNVVKSLHLSHEIIVDHPVRSSCVAVLAPRLGLGLHEVKVQSGGLLVAVADLDQLGLGLVTLRLHDDLRTQPSSEQLQQH